MEQPPKKQPRSTPDSRQAQMADAFRNFQHCIQHCQKAVFFTDASGVLERVNPAFEKLTGYLSSEAVGRDLSWITAGGPASETYRKIWREIFEDRAFRGTIEVRRRDGNCLLMELSAIPVRDTKGQITSLVCTGRDMRQEQELKSTEARPVNAAAILAGVLSHDLSNTLMVISGCSGLVLEGLSQENPLWHKLHEIKAAADRARELTREMLAFNRDKAQAPESVAHNCSLQSTQTELPDQAETLLVVEDESMIRTATVEFLSTAGYVVLSATNGQEAFDTILSHPGKIDLVITDVNMPQMSGPRLAEAAAAVRPDIKVLFVSGHGDTASIQSNIDQTRNFLLKPFSLRVLGDKIRELLSASNRARAAGAS